MPNPFNKDEILLTIQAIQISHQKLSHWHAAAMYNISQNTFSDRMKGKTQCATTHIKQHKLDLLKKQILIQYILN